ncbi:hypothetical protein KVF89_14445 [Nocardioides carbamazepini]|uniref:hypothetical protein n=1 Tax=Nocardioides carbamazepini TaxID=2854259 RepID=UPI002149B1E8|nr:hypothetical protein [Nocardioides carbamazepini]MCR1783736.1 hypothetical protein [Nocardioides carbamazepini]
MLGTALAFIVVANLIVAGPPATGVALTVVDAEALSAVVSPGAVAVPESDSVVVTGIPLSLHDRMGVSLDVTLVVHAASPPPLLPTTDQE